MAHPCSLLRDPRVSVNLKGLETVSVQCDLSEVTTQGLSVHKVKKQAKKTLEDEGLKVDNNASSRLVISIATEVRETQATIVYAVQVELREKVALPRTADKAVTGEADTWRHQSSTGVAFIPFDAEKLGKSLAFEALQQVESFVNDWLDANSKDDQAPSDDSHDDDHTQTDTPEPDDEKLKKIKQKLEELLARLGVGNASTASIEKFDVSGTKLDFRATITHRQKNPLAPLGGKYAYSFDTTVEGTLDITSAATLADAKACTKLPPQLGGREVCIPLKDLGALV